MATETRVYCDLCGKSLSATHHYVLETYSSGASKLNRKCIDICDDCYGYITKYANRLASLEHMKNVYPTNTKE
jgi:hypothetical protein